MLYFHLGMLTRDHCCLFKRNHPFLIIQKPLQVKTIDNYIESDKEKFKKRLKAMGLSKLSEKFEDKDKVMRTTTPK